MGDNKCLMKGPFHPLVHIPVGETNMSEIPGVVSWRLLEKHSQLTHRGEIDALRPCLLRQRTKRAIQTSCHQKKHIIHGIEGRYQPQHEVDIIAHDQS